VPPFERFSHVTEVKTSSPHLLGRIGNEILLQNSVLLDGLDSIIYPLSKVISSKILLLHFEKLSYIAL
jgi:hypothetical protein